RTATTPHPAVHCSYPRRRGARRREPACCNVGADLCVRPDFRLPVGADLRVCPFPHDPPDNTWAHTQVRPYRKVTLRITSPSWILGNTSRPSTTWPKTVYLPSRNGCGSRQM